MDTNIATALAISGLVIGVIFLSYILLKVPHPLFSAIKSAVFGTLGIILLSATETYTGIKIPLNLISLGASALLGIPGIGMVAVLDTLFI